VRVEELDALAIAATESVARMRLVDIELNVQVPIQLQHVG
jgi:hypothetical protein